MQVAKEGEARERQAVMKYIFRLVLILVMLAALAVVGFAFVGDLSPSRATVETPVMLEVN